MVMGKTIKAIQKSRWNKVVIMAVCICMLFFVTGCGGSDSSSSKTDGGHEKILGMEKSAVDNMCGKPVEEMELTDNEFYCKYANGIFVMYENNKAGMIEISDAGAGEIFGLKAGDNADKIETTLKKYNFGPNTSDRSDTYCCENSKYSIVVKCKDQIIESIDLFAADSDSSNDSGGYAENPDSYSSSDAYAKSSDGIDCIEVLGVEKSVVDAYLGAPVAKLSDNAYQYSDFGVGYDDSNKAVTVVIGGTIGVSSGNILGLKIGDSKETVEQTLAEKGFRFVGINPDDANAYEYQYENYYLIVTYDESQSVVMMVLSA